ncbi:MULTISPECIES: SusC/RagA family TonB-linked outer membrane protein [Butyricimonas]|uniref:SusC/RagA family TonB-linked outer membrane protein n=1 Tax=Butyricimonas TaxID=574697 RepID=UPI00242ABBB5|nr:SusC/RagA family TonB-linked outer membrane protein [Butyricimonas paravirosa]
MKLTCVFMFFLLFHVSAKTDAQAKVSLEVENASLLDVIQSLRSQTGYRFFFNHNELKKVDHISVKFENEDLEQVLNVILGKVNLSYRVEHGVIIITPAQQQEEKKHVIMKGWVRDKKKQPMPGVTVRVIGTTLGTATTEKGWFYIELPVLKGALEFSFVGYKKQQVNFTEKTDTLQIVMEEDMSDLDEVVVRAYGSQNKREVVSAISKVTADEMKELPTASLVNMLQGRLAGVNVVNQSGAPGSAQMVAIRGYNSLMTKGASDGQPLYVIDGVPMHSFVSPVSGTNTMADIDPAMIESVEVLKDAAAASIYGSRAGNGVILITTKKGKVGDAKFSANVSYSVAQLMEYPLQLGGRMERWIEILQTRNKRDAIVDSKTRNRIWPTSYNQVYQAWSGIYDGFWGNGRTAVSIAARIQDSLNPYYNNQTNWWKYVFRTGKIINANVQATGGSERFQYMVNAGYYTETGIAVNSSYGRVSLSSNLTAKPTKKLDMDVRIHLSYMDKSRNSSNALVNNRYEAVTANPGSTSTLLANAPGIEAEWLSKMNSINDKADSYRALGSLRLQYSLFDGLSLSGSASVDFSQGNSNTFRPSTLDNLYHENTSSGAIGRSIGMLADVLLKYKKSFNEMHNVEVLLGWDANKTQNFGISGRGKGGPSDNIYYYDPDINVPVKNHGTGSSDKWVSMTTYRSDFREKAMVSYFARLGYNYKQRYLIEATIRRDGSSTFGENHRWANFPSVAVGWAFSEENFMRWADWLDWGKVRASYGTSGQIFDAEYLAHGLMMVYNDPFLENNGMEPNKMISPDLTWEKTEQYNIGLDLDLFDYRLKMKLDYYYKLTSSLIYDIPLPGNMLIAKTRTENAMELSNEGVELELETDILRNSAVLWRMKFNLARNWNRFEKSYNGKDEGQYITGRPISGMYVYADDGFYDSDEEVPVTWTIQGNPKYFGTGVHPATGISGMVGKQKLLDLDGNGYVNQQDRYYVGTAQPLAHGGWINELTWKNFSLNMLFNYCLGRSMINLRPMSLYSTVKNVNIEDMNFWEKPGDDADYPEFGQSFEVRTDSNVEKVHSVSLKQLTLGYDMSKKLSKKIGFSGVRLFFTAENLFYLSNYSGDNPEVVDIYTGVDNGSNYPLPRKYSVGLTLNF